MGNAAVWKQEDAIALCRKIEAICPPFGCHVALTGGLLYKDGLRKDADLVLYRIRQYERIDVDGLFDALRTVGIERQTQGDHWCIKASVNGYSVDFFLPDFGGDYATEDAPSLSKMGK